jgi:hypothetical protein
MRSRQEAREGAGTIRTADLARSRRLSLVSARALLDRLEWCRCSLEELGSEEGRPNQSLASIVDRVEAAADDVREAGLCLESAQVEYDVLCGCGWGRMRVRWDAVPHLCPVCGYDFLVNGGVPEDPEATVAEARGQLKRAARTLRATYALLRALGAEAG